MDGHFFPDAGGDSPETLGTGADFCGGPRRVFFVHPNEAIRWDLATFQKQESRAGFPLLPWGGGRRPVGFVCWLGCRSPSFTMGACARSQNRWPDWEGLWEDSPALRSSMSPPALLLPLPPPTLLSCSQISSSTDCPCGCCQKLISLCHFRHSLFLPGKTLVFGIVKHDTSWIVSSLPEHWTLLCSRMEAQEVSSLLAEVGKSTVGS